MVFHRKVTHYPNRGRASDHVDSLQKAKARKKKLLGKQFPGTRSRDLTVAKRTSHVEKIYVIL